MEDVLISSYSVSSDTNAPTETVSVSFANVQYEVSSRD